MATNGRMHYRVEGEGWEMTSLGLASWPSIGLNHMQFPPIAARYNNSELRSEIGSRTSYPEALQRRTESMTRPRVLPAR